VISRILPWALVIAACYWYWQGPYQARFNPSPAQQLEQIRKEVQLCIHGQEYQIGTTGNSQGPPEEYCAEKHGVYRGDDGRWYSYDIDKIMHSQR
jgi:hypothetical protein